MTSDQEQERSCGWCGEAPWIFRCATCDPRREKRVCASCARRWHSRGAAGAHVLTSRAGRAQPYSAWTAEAQAWAAASANGSRQQAQSQSQSLQPKEEQGVQIIADSPEVSDAADGGAGGDDTEEELLAAGDDAAPDRQHAEGDEGAKGEEEKLMPLNDLLALLPSDDLRLLDALSEYIHAALRVQDGLACARFAKCTRPECVRAVEIARHNASGEPPCAPDCSLGLEMYQHLAACTHQGCPFCLRVRLRKQINNVRAIEALVAKQRLAMKHLAQAHKAGASDAKAKFNFCATQLKEYERKRLQLVEHVEEMNALVLRLRLPIFNFPRPAWHLNSDPPIKREALPSPSGADTNGASVRLGFSAQTGSGDDDGEGGDGAADGGDDDLAGVDAAAYIRVLLAKKPRDAQARRKFEAAVELADAIVEASFCSPAKASRCLLGCQRILDHLQHHLDLSVCDDVTCTTVEYHFAHLSICAEEGESDACEYCLRVKERELMRALDMMEGELREAETKAQVVIDEISVSFATATRREHEAVVGQLEDELEQAEEYKRDMATKLGASRRSLRSVREQMEQLGVPTGVLRTLPQHFTKAVKKEASAKRRKW